MAKAKAKLVTGLFKSRVTAESAVRELSKLGYTRDDVSVIAMPRNTVCPLVVANNSPKVPRKIGGPIVPMTVVSPLVPMMASRTLARSFVAAFWSPARTTSAAARP